MIINNRTLTAITLFGTVLTASLVSQPVHAGISLNGIALNGMMQNGRTFQGASLNGVSLQARDRQGVNPLGTTPQAAGSAMDWGSIEGQLLGIELPPVTVEGSH
jgi:uncharacterized protein YjbI with pentapeptide repeats